MWGCNLLKGKKKLVRPAGIEPATLGLEGRNRGYSLTPYKLTKTLVNRGRNTSSDLTRVTPKFPYFTREFPFGIHYVFYGRVSPQMPNEVFGYDLFLANPFSDSGNS